MKKVKTLDTAKATQQSDIPTKILKQNSDYFAEYFYENINQGMSKSIFPSDLKLADVTPVYKKKSNNSNTFKHSKHIIQHFQNLRKMCLIKFSSFSILYCPNINAGFAEATVHNTGGNSD